MANTKSVKELVLDEHKLVTYVSLSKELCVHVNESKTLLRLVVEEIKQKQPEVSLNVNFIISGLLNNHSAKTLVCSETDLDTEKSKFRTVFFQHIYSVSQGLLGVDNAAFVSVNRFEDFPLCTGLVKSNSCTKRSLDELGSLKLKSVPAADPQSTTVPLKKVKPKDCIQNGTGDSVVKAHATKSVPTVKSEKTSPKKDAQSTSSASNKTSSSNGKKTTKGIAGFFSKANSAPAMKSTTPAQVNGLKKAPTPEEKKK